MGKTTRQEPIGRPCDGLWTHVQHPGQRSVLHPITIPPYTIAALPACCVDLGRYRVRRKC
jgi:hypothetical protein